MLLDSDVDEDALLSTVDRRTLDLAVPRRTEPEPEARLMDRPALKRESAPPAGILMLSCDQENADGLYDAVVEAAFDQVGDIATWDIASATRRS